ncbi:MAG TPA: aromatic-ring-hydroxylating dioxygenase subunit beta [Herbaspirillum sp.]|jgi:3-phenylpropionate/cinnamic acid dioxygenase small subunit
MLKLSGFAATEIDRISAREMRFAIEEFNTEYCAVLDSGEVELWPEFFTEDALYRVTAKENADAGMLVGLVYAEGKKMLHDRATAIARTQMFAPRYNLHVVGNVRVLNIVDGCEIFAQTNFILLQTLVEGPTTLHLAGKYYDRFEMKNGEMLLKERQVVYDTSIIANDLVYPV